MKVQIDLFIPEDHRNYSGDAKLPDEGDYEYSLEIDWLLPYRPMIGENISIDYFPTDWSDDKLGVWEGGRNWVITNIYWVQIENNDFILCIETAGGEK